MKTAYEYNIEKLKTVSPSMSYNGEEFFAWQKQARQKLSELLGLDKFEKTDLDFQIEYEKQIDDTKEIRFSFQSEDGYRVPCHLLLPIGIEKPPVMICIQGHSTGMHISLGRPKYASDEQTIKGGDRDFCVRAIKEGFAAIAIEQRNFGECGGTEEGPQCLYSAMTALIMGRTTIGERVWDTSRLIDVLEMNFSDVLDLSQICCMGNSAGGTTTAYVAALEDRIKLAMPSCAVCTYKDSIGAMPHCACNFVPHIAEYFDMSDFFAMAYPKYYVQVSGKEDYIFPLFGAKDIFQKGRSVYEKLGKGDRCTLIEGNGGHRFYADVSWPVVHSYINKEE